MKKKVINAPGGEYRVTLPAKAWVQRRNVLEIEPAGTQELAGAAVTFQATLGGTSPLGKAGARTGITADFVLDARGRLIIDYTEILRTWEIDATTILSLYVAGTQYQTNITLQIYGLLDPADTFPPSTPDIKALTSYYPGEVSLQPGAFFWPLKMLRGYDNVSPDYGADSFVVPECYGIGQKRDDRLRLYFDCGDTGSHEFTTSGTQSMTSDGEYAAYSVRLATADPDDQDTPATIYAERTFVPRDCERTYALARWVSFTGKTRVHVFELRNHKMSTANAVELEPAADNYNVVKGRTDSLALYLDGLCAFDVWYYGDLAMSSRVDISTDGGQNWQRVNVTTKDVTPQNGDAGQFSKLQISFDFAEYDAIIL